MDCIIYQKKHSKTRKRKLSALALCSPQKRQKHVLPVPSVHKKKKKPARQNIIGENMSTAKIANTPQRIAQLEEAHEKRKKVFEELRVERCRKALVKQEKAAVREKKSLEKQRKILKFQSITTILHEKNYTTL